MAHETTYYSCELGTLKISAENLYITEIMFTKDNSPAEVNVNQFPHLAIMKTCVEQLNGYFSGNLKEFTFPYQQNGTLFQQKVWSQLGEISFGTTISYMELSKKLGDAKVIRAAASANGRNSLAIVVPCHRVIGSNGSLVGYAGELWRKQWLLNHEAHYGRGVQYLF